MNDTFRRHTSHSIGPGQHRASMRFLGLAGLSGAGSRYGRMEREICSMRLRIEVFNHDEEEKNTEAKHTRCNVFILLLCAVLSAAHYQNYRRTLYSQYESRIEDILRYIEEEIDADELVYLNMPTGDSYSPATAKKYLDACQSDRLSFLEEISEWGRIIPGCCPCMIPKAIAWPAETI